MQGWQPSVLDVGGGCRDASGRAAWRHSDSSRSPSPVSVKLPTDISGAFVTAPTSAGALAGNLARVAPTSSWPVAAPPKRTLPAPPTAAALLTLAGSMPAPVRSRTPSPLATALPTMHRSRTPSPQPPTIASQAAGNRTTALISGVAHVGLLPPPEPIGDPGGPRAAAWLPQSLGAEAGLSISTSGVALRNSAAPPFFRSALPPAPVSVGTSATSVGSSVAAVAAGEFAVLQLRKEVSELRAELRQVRAALSDGSNTPSPVIDKATFAAKPVLTTYTAEAARVLGTSSLKDRRLPEYYGTTVGSETSHMTLGPAFGAIASRTLQTPTIYSGQPYTPTRLDGDGRGKVLVHGFGYSSSHDEMQNGVSGANKLLPPKEVNIQHEETKQDDQDEDPSFACDLNIAAYSSHSCSYSHDNYEHEWCQILGGENKNRGCPSLADTLLSATGTGPQPGSIAAAQMQSARELGFSHGSRRLPEGFVDNGRSDTEEVVLLHEASDMNDSRQDAASSAEARLALPWSGAENFGWADTSTENVIRQHSIEVPLDSLGCTFQRSSDCEANITPVGASGDELMDAAITNGAVAEQGLHRGPRALGSDEQSVAEQRNMAARLRSAYTPGSTSCDEDLLTPSKDDSGSCILVSPSRLEVSYVMSHRDEEIDIPLLDKDLAWTKALPAPPPTFSIPARKKAEVAVVRRVPMPVESHSLADDKLGQTTLLTAGMSGLFGDDTVPLSTSVLIGMTSPMSVDASMSLAASQDSSMHDPGVSMAALGRSFEAVDLSSSRSGLVKDSSRSPRSAVGSDASALGFGLQRRCYSAASSIGRLQSSASSVMMPTSSIADIGSRSASASASSLEPKYFAAPPPRESFTVPPVPSSDLVSTPVRQALGGIAVPTSLPPAPLTPAVSVSTSRTATPPSRTVTPRRQPPVTAAPANVPAIGSAPSRSSSPTMAAVHVSRHPSVSRTTTTAAPTSSAKYVSDANLLSVGRTRSLTPQRVVVSGSAARTQSIGYGSARAPPTVTRALPSRDPTPARTQA